MLKKQKNTVQTEASKTPSSKAGSPEVTNLEKGAEATEVGKKGLGGVAPVKGQEPKASKELVPVVSDEDRQVLRRLGAKMLTGAQISGSVSISCPDDKVADLAMKHGAQGLVDEFAPADAVESTYAPVIVGLRNAVMTSLHLATKGSGERRDVELNLAFKGAGVLGQLCEAYDAHRGHSVRRFTVGNVNVESGAQAIVGNVDTAPRQERRTEDLTIQPNKRKPRAT